MTDTLDNAKSAPSAHAMGEIVAAAILAPSAENTQPWRFRTEGDRLIVALDPADWLPSDVTGMLVLTGIGTAIENAVIAAREQGVEPRVRFLTDRVQLRGGGVQPIAAIEFTDRGRPDELYPMLARRCTSRRMSRRPVERNILERISDSIAGEARNRVDWLTTHEEIGPLAELVGLGNRMRFEYAPFHREFYENVRFSQAEAQATCDGLDVETLQFSMAVKQTLYMLRKWARMRVANWLGFSRAVARHAASEVRCSGAVGILTIEEPSVRGMIEGGRALERLWLSTVDEGIGFHPTASVPVFLAHARQPEALELPDRLQRQVAYILERFYRLFPHLAGRTLQMAFRVGYAEPPPVRSLRRNAADLSYI